MQGKRQGIYRLRPPSTQEEWDTYHRIRRDVMLEARKYEIGQGDEHAPGHHPLLLWLDGMPIGTIRIDVTDCGHAGLRLVAIDPTLQRQGCGRVMLLLAERFARKHGCHRMVVYATPEAAGFYGKSGYVEDDWDDCYISGIVQMAKTLDQEGNVE